jgi:DNA-binding XRE family transcriptional regulator
MQASYDFLRAARALLDITPTDLAQRAKVSTRSIVRIEAREPVGLEISMRVQAALEELGVEFLPETKSRGPAMRVRKGVVKKIGFQLSDARPR